MQPNIIREYYMLNGAPVVLLMTRARVGMQCWVADRVSGEMKRDYASMNDVVQGRHDGQISEDDFMEYCRSNHISSTIPPRSVALSFRLAQQGQGLADHVPVNSRRYVSHMVYTVA